MKFLILLIGLTIISCNSDASKNINSQDSNSETSLPNYDIAIKFINEYVQFCNDRNSKLSTIEYINNQTLVTKEFQSELASIFLKAEKEDPELGLGFDPIFDAQDYPNEFEIEKIDSNYLIVRGKDWSNFRLTLKLKFDGNKWLVDGSGIINIPQNKRIER